MTTRFRGPILNSGHGNMGRKNLPIDKNPDYVTVFDDFTNVTLDDKAWTSGVITGGTVLIDAESPGGMLDINHVTTSGSGGTFQGDGVFEIAPGKDLWFETSFKTNNHNILFETGLTIPFTKTGSTFGLSYLKFKSDVSTYSFEFTKGTSEILTLSTVPARAIDETVKVGFHVVNGTHAECYYNDVHMGNLPVSNLSALTVGGISTSTAAGSSSTKIDYVLATQER